MTYKRKERLDHWTSEDFEQLKATFDENYGPNIGWGRHRVVYSDGDWVLKVPTKPSGINANCHEDSCQGPNYAKAKLDTTLTEKFGIPILRMELVVHRGFSEIPDWTWGVDGGQVGYTKDGRLVAYDWEHY